MAKRGFTFAEALELSRAALDDAIKQRIRHVRFEIEVDEPVLAFTPPRGLGILHEDIVKIIALAEKHSGRTWVQNAGDWCGMAILCPVYDPPGPGGTEAESGAKKQRRDARRGSASHDPEPRQAA